MSQEATIRNAEDADRPELRTIYLESRRQTFLWADVSQFELDDFDRASAGEQILVADLGGKVVGFVAWWPPENFVHSLFIAPGYTGQGLGKRLLAACLEQIGRPARLKCSTQNDAALKFYRTQGWQAIDRARSSEGEYFLLELVERTSGSTARPNQQHRFGCEKK